MNAEKLTQKSIDAVRKAQSIAVMQSNSVIEPIHLLAGLVRQENGLIPQLLKKMNIDEDIFNKLNNLKDLELSNENIGLYFSLNSSTLISSRHLTSIL